MSKAKIVVYKHNDMEDLKNKIEANPSDFSMAVSDAVFSMDGDILNLPEFVRICKEHGVLSMIDEAHATGVIGKTGHGIVEHFNNTVSPDIIMGTLSKAVGGEGGFVSAIRYPTVAKKRARLRIAIMSSHTKEELKRAADILLGILVSV